MATAGIILGWIGVAGLVSIILIVLFGLLWPTCQNQGGPQYC